MLAAHERRLQAQLDRHERASDRAVDRIQARLDRHERAADRAVAALVERVDPLLGGRASAAWLGAGGRELADPDGPADDAADSWGEPDTPRSGRSGSPGAGPHPADRGAPPVARLPPSGRLPPSTSHLSSTMSQLYDPDEEPGATPCAPGMRGKSMSHLYDMDDDDDSNEETPTRKRHSEASAQSGCSGHNGRLSVGSILSSARRASLSSFASGWGSWAEGGSAPQAAPARGRGSCFWRSAAGRCLLAVVGSQSFDMFCGGLILANAVLIGVETEHMTNEPDTTEGMFMAQFLLNLWYIVELLLRVFTGGVKFFYATDWRWNMFDTVLVATSLIDMFAESMNVGGLLVGRMLRVVRLLRVVRTLRIVRLLRYLRVFRKMVFSVAGSMQTLFWSLLLLFFLVYSFAIWFTQGVADYLHSVEGQHGREEQEDSLREHYGSLGRSIYTLFQSISTGASWGVFVEPLFAVDPFL
ncbi:unnamed protein product, partial [Prorocentrum cordatum]